MAKRDAPQGSVANIELPGIYISGDYLDDVSLVRSTTMSMTLNVGRTDVTNADSDKDSEQKKFLVPFVTVTVNAVPFEKSDDPEGSVLVMRKTLPLENAAFLVWDLSFELNEAVADLVAAAGGKVEAEPKRLEATAQLLNAAVQKINQAILALGEIGVDAHDR